jgi:acyl-CoA synthetase (AMP-forming)/AMP-acid ligase II
MDGTPTILPRCADAPDACALDDGQRRRTWAELDQRVRRLAHWLRGTRSLAPDCHVAVLVGNRAEAIECVLAAMCAGLWVTPVNRHLRPDEIAHVLGDSGAALVIADAEHASLARDAGARDVARVGGELERAIAAAPDAPLDPNGPAGGTMIYTSGTTGRPKGVQRAKPATLAAALAGWRRAGTAIGLDGSGPHLVTGPLYHAAPLLFAVYDLLNGAPIIVMPRWDEARALALLRERAVHHTHLVPTMFVRLLRLAERERASFRAPELQLVLHGAAPIAPSVKQDMIAWWGPVLVEYWGGTESGVVTLVDSAEWLAHPGTVGRALQHWDVFAVDEAGRRLPAGRTGALYSRHRELARPFAYHRDPEKTARAYLDDAPGGLTLGDVGWIDDAGWVYLCDRRSNMIISGGVNVYPAEIEQVLIAHPAVADVGVFGIPDDEWGETVKAAVELAPGREASPALAADILAFARERLAGYKVPRSIDFETALPRHPTGKLLIRELRDRYWRGRDRRI